MSLTGILTVLIAKKEEEDKDSNVRELGSLVCPSLLFSLGQM